MRFAAGIAVLIAVFAGVAAGGLARLGSLHTEIIRGSDGDDAAIAGWKTYRVRKEGFTVRLPEGWEGGRNGVLPARVARLRQARRLPRSFAPRQFVPSLPSIKFLAVDLTPLSRRNARRDNAITTVNVVRRPTTADLDGIAKSAIKNATSTPNRIGPVRDESVRLPEGDAIRVQYRRRVSRRGLRPIVLSYTQYGLVKDRSLFVLTLTTTQHQAALYTRDFERIAESFRAVAPASATSAPARPAASTSGSRTTEAAKVKALLLYQNAQFNRARWRPLWLTATPRQRSLCTFSEFAATQKSARAAFGRVTTRNIRVRVRGTRAFVSYQILASGRVVAAATKTKPDLYTRIGGRWFDEADADTASSC
ncbi:MAG TPA: hypothetical protein VFL41_12365 [Gaiellaceae bacterium]|nr:hypothetical protein [Gaiellaceae bacterium]HET8652623.1 hypothetical protein [Gaiellaceae bacterium]